MEKSRAKHVVVDTVAFFKNIQLQDIAENVYTTQGVVNEIRDAATRRRLAVLPYDLRFRDPTPECSKIISDFAKKTGDYRSLSAVDLQVLSLAYQLTKEHHGTEHLKAVPEKKVTLTSTHKPLVKATDIEGFYLPPKDAKPHQDEGKESATPETDPSLPPRDVQETGDVELELSHLGVREEAGINQGEDSRTECDEERDGLVEEAEEVDGAQIASGDEPGCDISDDRSPGLAEGSRTDPASSSESMDTAANSEAQQTADGTEDIGEGISNDDGIEADEGSEEEEEDMEDDGAGWITPGNISRIRQGAGEGLQTADGVIVGCMTADFAMQNVLIQIGIPVVSVEGMLIKAAKSFVLRCRACFKITNKMTKVFCPHCGNKTLDKVTVSIDEDGSQHIHLSSRKVINKRGLKYPLPLPQGGKHADNPILVEDQPVPHNRLSRKGQVTTDVFNTDYIVGSSPFALKDTTSKSAQLGVRSFVSNAAHHRRNPNQVRPKKGRKK